MNIDTFDGLREHYHITTLILARANSEFESHLEAKAQAIFAQYEQGETISRSDTVTLHEVEVQYAMMLRYAMLPRFLGLLERMIKGLCKVVDPVAYETVKQREWLEEHLRFLELKGIDLSPIQKDADVLRHLISLRDCIVHANGEIALCRYPGRVHAAINAIDTARPLNDGFLYLGDQVIPTAKSLLSGMLLYLFYSLGHPLDTTRYF
jgi:hypothetical protein